MTEKPLEDSLDGPVYNMKEIHEMYGYLPPAKSYPKTYALTMKTMIICAVLMFIAGFLARGAIEGFFGPLIPAAHAQGRVARHVPGVEVMKPVGQTPGGTCVLYRSEQLPGYVYTFITECANGTTSMAAAK